MAKKRILRTEELFAETEEVATALAGQVDAGPQHVPVNRLVPNRFNPRQTYPLDSQQELARSMREHGFIGSLDGRELPDGRVEVAYGSRRLLAARDAGLRTIPVALHDWSDAQMCFVSLAENLAREALSSAEETAMVRQMRDGLRLAAQEIVDRAGWPATWVDERLAAGDAAAAVEERNPEEAALDEIVASLVDTPGPASVYRQEEPFDDSFGMLPGVPAVAQHRKPRRRGDATPGSTMALTPPWVATGTTMLEMATVALDGFEPDTLPGEEVDVALRWLGQLGDRVASLSEILQARGQTLPE